MRRTTQFPAGSRAQMLPDSHRGCMPIDAFTLLRSGRDATRVCSAKPPHRTEPPGQKPRLVEEQDVAVHDRQLLRAQAQRQDYTAAGPRSPRAPSKGERWQTRISTRKRRMQPNSFAEVVPWISL
jgi:hypothetical protein